MDKNTLEKCLSLLQSFLDRNRLHKDKNFLLELGYFLKEELDTLKKIEEEAKFVNLDELDKRKLLSDNIQLNKEKQYLIKNYKELSEIVNDCLPKLNAKADYLTKKINQLDGR